MAPRVERLAESVREKVNQIRFQEALPLIVEVPGPEGPGEEGPSLLKMIRDAVACHFDESNRPSAIRLHFVRDEVMSP